MQGRLFAFLAIILFLFGGMYMVQAAYWNSSNASQQEVGFNESVAISEGSVSALSVSNNVDVVYAPQSDIVVSQNGTQVDAEPGNWSWNQHNGTILIQTGTSLNTTETAFVDGYYTIPSESQNLTKTFALLPTRDFSGAWQLAGAVFVVLGALALAVRLG